MNRMIFAFLGVPGGSEWIALLLTRSIRASKQ